MSIKVIYIMGGSRSGSTVLDAVLGNHRDVQSVGELSNASRVWANTLEYCACGQQADKCLFWHAVRDRWGTARPVITAAADWPALQGHFERIRHMPLVYAARFWQSNAFREYAQGMRDLYEAIAAVSGKRAVVDSSKSAARALMLTRIEGIDLRLIHLVRDGRGVAWSLMKSFTKAPEKGVQHDMAPTPLWRTAWMWRFTNRLSEVVIRRLPAERRLFLRYEDFINSPEIALQQIGRIGGLDYSRVADALKKDKEMNIGHSIAGNRVRMCGPIRLRPDINWQRNLTPAQRRLFWLIAGRGAARYGYVKAV